tara:strand:+ start:320 stop:1138 length:819 start_codon:yes stop_codon:yes gene_type:complete
MERVGLIQMTSGPDVMANLANIETQVAALAKAGASMVITPENCVVFGNRADYHHNAERLGDGIAQRHFASLAKQHKVWLVVGSMPIRRTHGVSTTTLVFDPSGECKAQYDKLHMFDVDVADGHSRYRESETFTPGSQIVSLETPVAHLGLTICYDVRFPQLYSELAQRGANLIIVPAAFTAVTGEAHWEALLRARAIESQSWIVAVNQCGVHPCGRETWGHSMVISPWGEVVASLSNQPQNLVADIDLSQVDELRTAMPVLKHTRFHNQLKV